MTPEDEFIRQLEHYFFESEPMSEHSREIVKTLLKTYGDALPKTPAIVLREKTMYKRMLKQLEFCNSDERKITVEDIFDIVIKVTEISRENIVSKCRKREYVGARHLCLFFIRNYFPEISLKQIGEMFGNGMDHTTVIHAREKIKDLLEIGDYYFTQNVRAIEAQITSINSENKLSKAV